MNLKIKIGRSITIGLGMAFMPFYLLGCAGIGPGSVPRDRFDYTVGISESWKNQMLLNIVKMRYGDAPVFLEVASITSQYEIAGNINLSAQWGVNPPYSTTQIVGAQGTYADRPTLTYSPLGGEKFAKTMMDPIPPGTILSLIRAGYSAKAALRGMANSINRVRNSFVGGTRTRPADPEFFRLLDKLEILQESDILGIHVNGGESVVTFFYENVSPEIKKDLQEIKEILGLSTEANEFKVVYGSVPGNDQEIAVLTRSLLEILKYLGSTIDVPIQHVSEKLVNPTMREKSVDESIVKSLISVKSSREKPTRAFVAVPYRDYWFWIDERDYDSKGAFSTLMFIFSLAETGEKGRAPILTIPAR